ncbi:Gfo/Idh/MocA family oxidoreductase [candidate division KSB1 bacterium]|nr:Gfo/Idh/MocA family oxidoreductase [candidate division KSB1 bacterium]
MDRRKFLKQSALGTAALAVPTFIPSSVLGRAGFTPPSDRINLGCIGLGGQGSYNMLAFASQPDVEITTLCDVNTDSDDYTMLYQFPGSSRAGLIPAHERLKQYREGKGQQQNDCRLIHDFKELLDVKDIDAVSVCTPDHWHGLISIAAAQAGKDIYCEKPLVNTVAEGRILSDAVRQNGRILQTGSHERSNDSVRFAYDLVQNGRIGQLKQIRVNMPNNDSQHLSMINNTAIQLPTKVPAGFNYDMWLGPTPWVPYIHDRTHFWWRYISEYGGGEMTDRGAHIIDLAQFINNSDDTGPVKIRAKGKQLENPLYDAFIEYDFTCQYANGVELVGSSDSPRGLKLIGSDGWIFIHIHGGRLEAEPQSLLREQFGSGDKMVERSPGHHRNFLDSMKLRRDPVAHVEIGHRTATLCHLINIALETGRPIEWNPDKEQITNDETANQMLKRPMRSPWHL